MLDYVWARLPIVCTDGDVFAHLVRSEGLGAVVPPGDATALAHAIDRLLGDEAARSSAGAALGRLGRELHWSRVVAPLARFLEAPASAANHAVGLARVRANLQGGYRGSKWLKRTALRLGVTERRVEQLKRLGLVRALVAMRNRVAARARDAPRALTVLTRTTAELHRGVLRGCPGSAHGPCTALASCDTQPAHHSGRPS